MILNKTKNKIVCEKSEILESPFRQGIGLMFSFPRNLVFTFKEMKKISLHNFFVFFPIDVIFLDDKKKVIEIKQNFKPFSFYFGKKKAKYVLELVEKANISIGDQLSF